MISRYTSGAMASLWSEDARYERWRQVELAVLAAQVRAGHTPPEILVAAEAVPCPPSVDIQTLEAATRHDFVAFLNAWTAGMEPRVSSYVHRHLTSSDVVDTAQSQALDDATKLIATAGRRLLITLATVGLEHKATLCVARTHGQAATFDVVGHRFADFAFALDRVLSRLESNRRAVAVVNISGPVGTGIELPPALVRDVANALDLAVPLSTTQVVFRDAIAAWVMDLALLGAVCESVAIDVRLGQHDGVSELIESRGESQEGSSAMPHKRNPILAENICGLARLLRGYVGPVVEDIALWQHRDISHSSVERVALPDAAALSEHILNATAQMVGELEVDLDSVQASIERSGSVLITARLQSRFMSQGLRREDAAREARQVVASGEVSRPELDAAAEEALTSEVLRDTFANLIAVKNRYVDAMNSAPDR